MKKIMNRTARIILDVAFCICFVMIFSVDAETECPTWVNIASMAGCAVCGKCLDKLGAFDDVSDEA